MALQNPYSLIAITGVMFFPAVGEMTFGGAEGGLESVSIQWQTERTTLDKLPDGTITAVVRPGNNATLTMVVNQDQALDQFLQAWSNSIDVALSLSNVSLALAGKIAMTFQSSGAKYTLSGVAPSKIPDITYGESQPRRTWTLVAARAIHD